MEAGLPFVFCKILGSSRQLPEFEIPIFLDLRWLLTKGRIPSSAFYVLPNGKLSFTIAMTRAGVSKGGRSWESGWL